MQSPPRISYRMLGTIQVTGPDGKPLEQIATRPKALALLAYLAIECRTGPSTRDTVLGHFWPDSNMAQARHALRQALYELRQVLGQDVIETRGQQAIMVLRGPFNSDAVELLDALDAGRLREAVELYQGDLLPGLHFADESAEFERWLDGKRDELRRRVTEALWDATRTASANGRHDEAIRWARRALTLDPYNEAGLRDLMEQLHQAGRGAEAIVVFRRFQERLATDLDVTCGEETERLARQIERAAGPPVQDVPIQDLPAQDLAVDHMAAAPTGVTRSPERPKDRRGDPLVLLGVAVLIAFAAVVALAAVATAAFRDQGVGLAAAHRSSARLGDDTIGPRAGPTVLSLESSAQDPIAGQAVATALSWVLAGDPAFMGARVRGGVQQRGATWQADIEVTRGGREITRITALGEGDLVALVRALGDSIADAMGLRPNPLRWTVLPRDEATLRMYVRGEWLLDRGEVHAATDAFEQALRMDSTFALGHHRLSVAAGLAFDVSRAQAAEGTAVILQHQLPDAEARIVEARQAYRTGEPGDAEALLRSVLSVQPEHPEALFQVAEVLFHFNPLRGRPVAEAGRALEQASRHTAGRTESFYHLAQVALLTGDTARFDSASARMLELAPTGVRNLQVRSLRARVLGSREDWRRDLAGLAGARDLVVLSAAHNHAVYGGDIPAALNILEILTRSDRDPGVRARAHAARAELLAAAGRPSEVAGELRRALAIDPLLAASRGAHLLTIGVLPPADTALQAIAVHIRDAQPRPPRTTSAWIAVETTLEPWLDAHGRAMAALALGDPASAEELILRLEARRPARRTERILATDLVLRLWHADQAPPDAAAAGHLGVAPEEAVISPLFSRPLARLLGGRLDREVGRIRQAERWFQSILEHSMPDLALSAVALGELIHCAERRTDHAAVGLYLARLDRLHAHAEPAYLEWRNAQAWAPRRPDTTPEQLLSP